MLNQNYEIANNVKRCRVAVGQEFTRSIVHDDFKCILVVSSKKMLQMDAPLLNRFEKHYFDIYEDITEDSNIILAQLQEWTRKISKIGAFDKKDMIPVLAASEKALKDSLMSLIVDSQNYQLDSQEERLLYCKQKIMALSSQCGAIRSLSFKGEEQIRLVQNYIQEENHLDIFGLINQINQQQNSIQQNTDFDESKSIISQMGFSYCAYSYQIMIDNEQQVFKELSVKDPIVIDAVRAKKDFKSQIDEFFNPRCPYRNQIITADSGKNDQLTLWLCRSLINQSRNEYNKKCQELKEENPQFQPQQKNVFLIIKIYGTYYSQISFGYGWNETFIDVANGKGKTQIHVNKFINRRLDDIIDDREVKIFDYLYELSLPQSISYLRYINTYYDFNYNEKVHKINYVLTQIPRIKEMCRNLFKQNLKNEGIKTESLEWELDAVKNIAVMNQSKTFHQAAIQYLKSLLSKFLAFFVSHLEKQNIIEYLTQQYEDFDKVDTILNAFENFFISQPYFSAIKTYTLDFSSMGKYPFFNSIFSKYEEVSNSNSFNFIGVISNQESTQAQDLQVLQNIIESLKIKGDAIKRLENQSQRDIDEEKLNAIKEEILAIEKQHEKLLQDIVRQEIDLFKELEQKIPSMETLSKEDQELLKLDLSEFKKSISKYRQKSGNDKCILSLFKILTISRDESTETVKSIYCTYLMYLRVFEKLENLFSQFSVLIDDYDEVFLELQEQIFNVEKEYKIQLEEGYHPKFIINQAIVQTFFKILLPNEQIITKFNDELRFEDIMQKLHDSLLELSTQESCFETSVIQMLIQYKLQVIDQVKELDKSDIDRLIPLTKIAKQVDKQKGTQDLITQIINLSQDEGDQDDAAEAKENNQNEQDQKIDSQGEESERDDEEVENEADSNLDLSESDDENDPSVTANVKYREMAEDEEEKKEEQENDEESEEDCGEQIQQSSQKEQLIFEFILKQLELELDKVPKSQIEGIVKFSFQVMAQSPSMFKSKPFLALGLFRKILQEIQSQIHENQFTRMSSDSDPSIEDLNQYKSLRKTNNLFNRLHHFCEKIIESVDQPLAIIVCDILEESLQSSIMSISQNDKWKILKDAFNISLQTTEKLLRRFIATSICRILIQDLSSEIVDPLERNLPLPSNNQLLNQLTDFLRTEQEDRVRPYIFYLFKQVSLRSRKFDQQQIYQIFKEKYSFMRGIRHTESEKKKGFKILAEINSENKKVYNKLHQGLIEIPEFIANASQNKNFKIFALQVFAQNHYLLDVQSGVQSLPQQLLNLFDQDNKHASQIANFIRHNRDDYSTVQEEVLQNEKGFIGEILLYTIIAVSQLDNKNFFKHILMNPLQADTMYWPFVVNSKFDLMYDIQFKSGDKFARYRCKTQGCGEEFIVGDCGKLSNERSQNGANVGGKICECGVQVGYGGEKNCELIDRFLSKQNFSPEYEARQGYIYQDPEIYNTIDLREINKIPLILGQIVINFIILGAVVLNKEDVVVKMKQIYTPTLDKVEALRNQQQVVQREQKLESKMAQLLIKNINTYCQMIKDYANIDNNKMKLLIQSTICDLATKNCFQDSFNYEPLTQKWLDNQPEIKAVNPNKLLQNRKDFERMFSEELVKDYRGSFSQFFNKFQDNKAYLKSEELDKQKQELAFQARNQMIIDETFAYPQDTDQSLISAELMALLKNKSSMTLDNLKHILEQSQGDSSDSMFILKALQRMDDLQTLGYFQDVLEFFKLIQIRFDGKISYEESLQNSIEVTLEKYAKGDEDKRVILAKFVSFSEAWNDLRKQGISNDGCDQINLPIMDKSQKFQYLCLTNQNKDQLGIYFYYIFKHFSGLQNKIIKHFTGFIEEVVDGVEIDDTMPPPNHQKVLFYDLRKYQIVSHRFDINDFMSLIRANSINKLEFGQGRSIELNIEKIKETLYSQIVRNKNYIEFAEETAQYQFTFENLTNPYNQYIEIKGSILQEPYPASYKVIESKRFEERYGLLMDLQTTLNYLQQTKGKPEDNLKEYMANFKILSHSEIDEAIQLKHILHFYESVEDTLHDKLVRSVNNNYQQPLQSIDAQELDHRVSERPDCIYQVVKLIARLLIRQLSYSTVINSQTLLFPYLFDSENSYLHGIGSQINNEELSKVFHRIQIVLAQSQATYQELTNRIREFEDAARHEEIVRQKTLKLNMEKERQQIAVETGEQAEQEDQAFQNYGVTNFEPIFDDISDDESSKQLKSKEEEQKKPPKKPADKSKSTKPKGLLSNLTTKKKK